MRQYIRIRVALTTSIGVNVNPSEDQRSTLNQPVCVVANANSEHVGLRKSLRLDRALVPAERTSPHSKRSLMTANLLQYRFCKNQICFFGNLNIARATFDYCDA